MIIVFSNKKTNPACQGEGYFSEEMDGPGGLMVNAALASPTSRMEKVKDKWAGARLKGKAESIALSEHEWALEPVDNIGYGSFFQGLIHSMKTRKISRKWLLHVHGSGKNTLGALEQAREIQTLHGLNVISFVWPSWTPLVSLGLVLRMAPLALKRSGLTPAKLALALGYTAVEQKLQSYGNARETARTCSSALASTIAILEEHFIRPAAGMEGFTISMLAHSLGCLLVESLARETAIEAFEGSFANLVLNAADVDSEGHSEWASRLKISKRLYVTHNNTDAALLASRGVAGNKSRLGAKLKEAPSPNVTAYIDMSKAKGATARHALFLIDEAANPNVKRLFTSLLGGEALFTESPGDGALAGCRLQEGNRYSLGATKDSGKA